MATMEAQELQSILEFLIGVAHEAGDMIMSAKPTTDASGSKKNIVDIVTETDKAVEKMVSTKLSSAYPSFKFIGEETYKPGMQLTDEPTFIVDPIDGTTNFVHSHPYVSISLGLAVGRQPVVGVVYNPFLRILYTAAKDQGAYITQFGEKTRLPLRQDPEPLGPLSSSLIAVEWGSDRSGNDYDVKVKTFRRLGASTEEGGAMVQSMRSLGSAALNLCGVASGHLDAYWEAGCWAWDVCAGWCILSEAGGLMADANPGNWAPRLEERRYLAVRKGAGQKEFVKRFWECVEGRFEMGM